MKFKTYYFAVMACCGLVLTACGSSSNDNNAPTLPVDQQNRPQTEAEALNAFCLNHPNSSVCNQAQQEGTDMGFEEYNQSGGQGYFDPNDYNNYSGGQQGSQQYANLCGCRQGTTPTLINGVIMCAQTYGTQSQSEVIRFGVSVRSQDGDTSTRFRADYDYIEVNERDTIYTNPVGPNNCHNTVQAGCDPYGQYQCQGFRDSYGRPVQAYCQQVPGHSYGQCVQRY
jgi:hypothetical protein